MRKPTWVDCAIVGGVLLCVLLIAAWPLAEPAEARRGEPMTRERACRVLGSVCGSGAVGSAKACGWWLQECGQ